MKIGLSYINQMRSGDPGKLGGWIANSFSALVAAISAGYHQEHTADDHHGDIKALSLSLWNPVTGVYDVVIPRLTGAANRFQALAHVSAGSADTNVVTTGAIDTTGAGLIVVVLSDFGGTGLSVVSDSKGNAWTALTGFNQASNARCTIFYTVPTAVGTGHTFTAAGVVSYPSVCVGAFVGGRHTSPVDQQNGAGGASPLATGSVTPLDANELVIAGVTCWTAAANVGPTAIDAGFTFYDHQDFDGVAGPTHYGGGIAYKIQTTSLAVNPSWTTTAGVNAAVIATFRVAT